MGDISAPPTRAPSPNLAPHTEVKAPSASSDHPSPQQQSAEKGDGGTNAGAEKAASSPAREAAVLLSATLAHVRENSVLTAKVSGTDQKGVTELVTKQGTFLVRLEDSPPRDTEITIRVISVGATVLASLTSTADIDIRLPDRVELALARLPDEPPPGIQETALPGARTTVAPAVTYGPPSPLAPYVAGRGAPGGYGPGSNVSAGPGAAVTVTTVAAQPGSEADIPQIITGTELKARVVTGIPPTARISPSLAALGAIPERGGLAAGTELTLSLLTVQAAQAGAAAPTVGAANPPLSPLSAPVIDGLEIKAVVTAEVVEAAANVATAIADSAARGEAGASATKAVLLHTNIGVLRAEVPSSLAIGDQLTARVVIPAVDAAPTPGVSASLSPSPLPSASPSPAQAPAHSPALAPAQAPTPGMSPGVTAESAFAPAAATPPGASASPPATTIVIPDTVAAPVTTSITASVPVPVTVPVTAPITAPITAPALVAVLEPIVFADPGTPDIIRSLTNAWTTLDDALAVVENTEPSVATDFARSALPTPGNRLSSTLLFFLAALRNGDARGWLGREMTQALANAKRGELAGRLEADISRIGRLATEGSGHDWRAIILPFHNDHDFMPLVLFVRQEHSGGGGQGEGDANSDEPEEGGTRFVLEVALDRLGELQLDGVVGPGRLDLVVRSNLALSEAMRRDILDVFMGANDALGLDGNLIFEAGASFRVSPLSSFATTRRQGSRT